ncbi:2-hydroxyacyl-CoA dehydratase [bacterium]|nr:2-hydroxyacyl-CoA dehydratase [bacterium]
MICESTNNYIEDFRHLETEYPSNISGSKSLIGYLCLRVPVELIEAYGAVPLRIVPQTVNQVDGLIPIRTDACSFCRTVPMMLKSEPYCNLDAVIVGACCDQIRRLTETLDTWSGVRTFFYAAPRTWNQDRGYFIEQMKSAFAGLGQTLGLNLNMDRLQHYIEVRNKLRTRINKLRDEGRMSAKLLQKLASSPLPADEISRFLDRLKLEADTPDRVRIMLMGSVPGGYELDVIEEAGGNVVADATCLGDRSFLSLSSSDSDPIALLYESYVENNNCPHRRPLTPLIEYTRDLIVRRNVAGVIYRSVKYCHPFGLSADRFKAELGIPFLKLDDDLTSLAIGGLRTRIGAFIEMLEAMGKRREA